MTRKAYVLIDVEKGKAVDVVIELNGKPGILAADVIMGPRDVVAVVEANDVNALAHLIENQ